MRNIDMKNAVNEDIYYINQKDVSRSICMIRMCGITYPDKTYEIIRPSDTTVAAIEYVEKGEGTVHIGDKTFYPKAGDAYLLHPKKAQHYYSDSENPWKKCFVVIWGELTERLIEAYNLNNLYHFKGLDIKEDIYEIINLTKARRGDNTTEIISIINRILFKMRLHAHTENTTSDLSEKIKDYLDINAISDFRMENLCEYVSKSESHIIRVFKKAYGITPYTYVINKKINHAKDLLINTNLSIKQISLNLHFADEFYFSNVFKSKIGISPFNYRKAKKRTL